MPQPTILFGMLLATLYGSIYHYLRGGSARHLLFELLLAWAGFWAGDQFGYYLGWNFWSVGLLNAGMGTVTCLALLVLVDIVSHIPVHTPEEEDDSVNN